MGAAVYRCKGPFADPSADTLVICCSSNAYFPFTQEFLAVHLSLAPGTFDLLAVPGGAQLLLATEYLPKFAWVGHRWLKFFTERSHVRRIVVVAHDDCGWYKAEHAVPAFLHTLAGAAAGSRQREDLARIVAALRSALPMIAVEAYFAAKGSDGHVEFTRE